MNKDSEKQRQEYVHISFEIALLAYLLYRYIIDPSVFLILLTVFDVIMIVLTYLEYRRMKSTPISE